MRLQSFLLERTICPLLSLPASGRGVLHTPPRSQVSAPRRLRSEWTYSLSSALLFACAVGLFTPSSLEAKEAYLRVGQLSDQTSLPSELLLESGMGTGAIAARSGVFPSALPSPQVLSALPDVVDVLVGLYDNDIPALADADLIVPLDGFFEEIGVRPQDLFLENALRAVMYRGKIWAVPHQANGYLLSYNRRTFQKLKLPGQFSSWTAILDGAEQISLKASPNAKVTGFWGGGVPVDPLFAFFIWISGNLLSEKDPPPVPLEIFAGYRAKGVIADVPPQEPYAMRLETFATAYADATVGLAPISTKITDQGIDRGIPAFLECFAIRTNTTKKLQASREFLKWLLAENTQIRLVQLTRLDKASSTTEVPCVRHVPLMPRVLESQAFTAICRDMPDYQVLIDTCKGARFAEPTAENHFRERAIIQSSRESALRALNSGGYFGAFAALLQPVDLPDVSVFGQSKPAEGAPKKTFAEY